ncbi:flagellar protein FliS [Devosia sp. YR412]|uniref:flagellar export chaperone FliS n=1 Tax=Devosia sp. YR412 TaxID=1881030 RepID=UPI0008BCED0A|nr:flagellar protein FliS [Devosia sp. YR412]SEQ52383.1 flagellar protein FliS [Devosia sp. YR412]
MSFAHNQAMSAYRTAAAQVPPNVAVVKLYDLAIRSIRLAIVSLGEGKVEDTYIAVNKACQVLRGLTSNLRFSPDNDMADTLKSTYVANMIALHTAFGKPDAARRYAQIAEGLLELRNAWADIAGMPRAKSLLQRSTSNAVRTPL